MSKSEGAESEPEHQNKKKRSPTLESCLKNEMPQVTANITRMCRFLNIQSSHIEETKRFSSKCKLVTCMTC